MDTAAGRPTVAVIGQGSIGRRHTRILQELGATVLAYDPDATPDAAVTSAASIEEALGPARAAIIASPTSEHARQACTALEHGCDVLVEKPLAVNAELARGVEATARARGGLLAVAMNLRFHPGPRIVRKLLAEGAIGEPLWARVSAGSHLPGWRPGTDYRLSYSARRELGGGVLLDVVHEIDYAMWIFGEVVEVSAWLERVSALELDVEDLALLTLRFASGPLVTLELDYLDRCYRRGCRIVGAEGTIEWDWARQEVIVHGGGTERRLEAPSDVAPTYVAEVERFLDAIASEPRSPDARPLANASEAVEVLSVVDAARASARSRTRVCLP